MKKNCSYVFYFDCFVCEAICYEILCFSIRILKLHWELRKKKKKRFLKSNIYVLLGRCLVSLENKWALRNENKKNPLHDNFDLFVSECNSHKILKFLSFLVNFLLIVLLIIFIYLFIFILLSCDYLICFFLACFMSILQIHIFYYSKTCCK